MQPQYTLREFPIDELQVFNQELQKFLDAHGAHLVARPLINEEGRIDGRLMAFKKVELIPKEDGTLVPKKDDNGESNKDKPEASPADK